MNTSWKQLLTEAEAITKENGKSAWRTAQIVRELWKDQNFMDEGCEGKPDNVEEKLSRFSGRFALGLNDMIQMIEHFPKAEDWESGRLDILRDKTCQILLKRSGKSSAEDDSERHRRAISIAQYEELQQKLRELQVKYRELEKQHKALLDTLRKPSRAKQLVS